MRINTGIPKAFVHTTQSIANKVHKIWEHNQHLGKASPDQCTPAFEGMPEAPNPFRDFCTFFINITSMKLGWTSAGQSSAQTLHTASCFHAVFLSSPLPSGSGSPVLLSTHKLLPNLHPTDLTAKAAITSQPYDANKVFMFI